MRKVHFGLALKIEPLGQGRQLGRRSKFHRVGRRRVLLGLHRGRVHGGRQRVIETSWVILLSAVLFSIGLAGVLVRRNAIVVFM